MRNRAAALLILTLSTSCSHNPSGDGQLEQPVSVTQTPKTVTSTAAPFSTAVILGAVPEQSVPNRQTPKASGTTSPSLPATTSTIPTEPPANPLEKPDSTQPLLLSERNPNAAMAAKFLIEQLIEGHGLSIPKAEMWARVVAGGTIIQTTNLAESANRATIAVSVAFETPNEGALTEPIALRLELLHEANGWIVNSIGYL